MLERLARFILRYRVSTLLSTSAFIIVSVLLILHGGRLESGGFKDTEAQRAQDLVQGVSGHPADTTFVAVFRSDAPGQTKEEMSRAVSDAVLPVREHPRVVSVVTPTDAPGFVAVSMINEEARTQVALVTIEGTFADALEVYPQVRARFAPGDLEVLATGRIPFMHDMNETLAHDLFRAELIALPLALLVLVLVFRSLVAASLPVGVGALSVLGGTGIVLGLSGVTDVAMYTINVCSLIGLGVSIDYCLFFVSRYREELAAHAKDEAIVRAMTTAGQTIAFSGLAVCTGLAGLLFFRGSYLFAVGIGGALVVGLAVLFALTFLPALISLLGDRLFFGRVRLPRFLGTRSTGRPEHGRFWARLARTVMRRPLAFGIPTLAILVALGLPFLHLRLAGADVRVLDRTVEARRGYEVLKATLPDLGRNRILVAVEFPSEPTLTTERTEALYDLAARARALPNVTTVQTPFYTEAMDKKAWLDRLADPPPWLVPIIEQGKEMTVGGRVAMMYVLTDATPDSEAARQIVQALRSDRSVADGSLVVGGESAHNVDATTFIRDRAPIAIGFVVIATLVLLFLLFRSVLLPISAVVMNFLSMTGSFGALVWIFQDGHLGVREPRPLEPSLPVLLFCVLFGLSMDYQVLLLSRIRESYVRTRNNTEAVAEGLQKTAGLITSAAAIMVAVFIAFAFARIVMIQAVGIGMALAVAIDATLVRTLLVPASMRLMGDLNWWAPRWPRARTRARSADSPLTT